MKKFILFLPILLLIFSCQNEQQEEVLIQDNLNYNRVDFTITDSLIEGSTYLSVYSEVYSQTEHKTHNLTATISMRNTSSTDTIYLTNAAYYNTKGDLLRSYIDHLTYVKPLETLEIVISEIDNDGGTGANFIFDWKMAPETRQPLFEAIMISTSGQQGLSFSTQGINDLK